MGLCERSPIGASNCHGRRKLGFEKGEQTSSASGENVQAWQLE